MGQQQASFNGVKFHAMSLTIGGGYRQAEHKFNNKKSVITQHGRHNKTFQLSSIFLGTAALNEANIFIAQLEMIGVGILYHPRIGEVVVATTTHSLKIEAAKQQVTVEMGFLENNKMELAGIDNLGKLLDVINILKTGTIKSVLSLALVNNEMFAVMRALANAFGLQDVTVETLTDKLTDALGLSNRKITKTNTTNKTAKTFIKQQKAILIAEQNADKKYQTTAEFKKSREQIIVIFDNDLINSSEMSQDFYQLKAYLSKQIITNNKDLPHLKTYDAKTAIATEVLGQNLNSNIMDFNNPVHPLFNKDKVYYVA